MPFLGRVTVVVFAFWLLTPTAPGFGQQPPDQPTPPPAQPPPPPAPTPARPAPTPEVVEPPVAPPAPPRAVTTPEEPFRAPGGIAAPPLFRGPDFFNPPQPRGFLTLTPSLAILGEYNDNLDLTARGKIDDFIVNIVPGFTLAMQGPSYQLSAGYNFGAEIFTQETDRSSWARSQQLFADVQFTLSPRTTLSLSEVFIYDRESNVVSASGISAGFINSWRNTVAARLGFQATQRTSLNVSAGYTALRYEDNASGAQDSDTYRAGVGAEYAFTPRLSGTIDFGAGYLKPEIDESVTAFSPQVGLNYQITRTLFGRVAGGATVSVFEKSDTTVTPSGSAALEQAFRYGSVALGYDRAITAEAIGITDRQTAFATLRLTSLRRELQFELSPFYTHTRNPDGSSDKDLDTFTVNVRLSYQIARNLTITGSYIFYKQQTSSNSPDIDQNRFLFGLQYAYPINFD